MIDIKDIAKRAICGEFEVIKRLQDYIDKDFEEIVKMIYSTKGRVVVTGIGKSAIIGQKIVATFNSTGTSSVFMHAADAIHGDLGMIGNDDIVICISKSGNTPEIKVLIPLIKNLGNNNIIGMVSNLDSYLAKNSMYTIKTIIDREVCPMNLAPTSSTTAQLVMGDALAVCLIKMRSFSSGDFAKYHPGGSLGKRLYLRVADVFDNKKSPSVNPKENIRKVILEISGGRLGAAAVLDDNKKLIGIITDGDLRRMLQEYDDINGLMAEDIMSKSPKTIHEEDLAYDAYQIMRRRSITQLIVSDSAGAYKGMIHIHDILREGLV